MASNLAAPPPFPTWVTSPLASACSFLLTWPLKSKDWKLLTFLRAKQETETQIPSEQTVQGLIMSPGKASLLISPEKSGNFPSAGKTKSFFHWVLKDLPQITGLACFPPGGKAELLLKMAYLKGILFLRNKTPWPTHKTMTWQKQQGHVSGISGSHSFLCAQVSWLWWCYLGSNCSST